MDSATAFAHLQLRLVDQTQWRYEVMRPLVLFADRTAAERFFGQKPRSMFVAILASVELPPAPLSPPRRAVG
jgi:hypothetical protein